MAILCGVISSLGVEVDIKDNVFCIMRGFVQCMDCICSYHGIHFVSLACDPPVPLMAYSICVWYKSMHKYNVMSM